MPTLATFNLCNLGADAPQRRLEHLAQVIVCDLRGPDILAVQEVKSCAPAVATGQVPGEAAYQAIIAAVTAAGGPRYECCEVAPLANQDGGQAGFNIRVGVLFNPVRVELIGRGVAGPLEATDLEIHAGGVGLTLSPGRIAPQHAAFRGDPQRHWAPSRKALAVEFRIQGDPWFVVVCHLKSMRVATRRESDYAKKQRHAQAEVIHRFVAELLACEPGAHVVVLGDMNDLPGSKTLKILKGDLLVDLLEHLHPSERYTRRHGDRPQALDHALASRHLRRGASARIPHVCSDRPEDERASDHDPVVVKLDPRGDGPSCRREPRSA